MKIKEVISQTGLTDRAIRLYIEHGLVTPENQKTYTGRNNYNFTQADIDRFEQIAMLRKADFSLEQIKTLMLGGESARKVLCEYLSGKQESVVIGQRIVEALKDFSEQEPVTIESVCRKIKESIENVQLPESDRKATKGERVEKWIMRSIASILLAVWGILGIEIWLEYRAEFIFPRYYTHPINYIGTAYIMIPILMSMVVLFLYRKIILLPKKRKKRRAVAVLSFGIALLTIVQPVGIAALAMIPPVYSETDRPENYLKIDTYAQMYSDDIYKLFPTSIPRDAVAEESKWHYPPDKFLDTTKYYYYYQDEVDPGFHIYAEWILPEYELTKERNRIANYYPEGAKRQTQWGEWTCLSFTDDSLDFDVAKNCRYYYYLIFAYNEKTGGVRYIASYAMDCDEDPYFLNLQWE